jgi:hypothetical protein
MLRDTTRGSSTATHDVEGSHIEHAFAWRPLARTLSESEHSFMIHVLLYPRI